MTNERACTLCAASGRECYRCVILRLTRERDSFEAKWREAEKSKTFYENAAESWRQTVWYWKDIAQRVFWLWAPEGEEYDHWVRHEPELGNEYRHLSICSKQSGKVEDCHICRGRSEEAEATRYGKNCPDCHEPIEEFEGKRFCECGWSEKEK